jgi:hypothetical protein
MMQDKYPLPHAQVAARIVDGAAVIVLADAGTVQVLDEVGTRIWELMDGSRTASQIAQEIENEYDVSLDQATKDVEELLQQLLAAQAIVLSDAPASG